MEYIFAGKKSSQPLRKQGKKIVEKRFKPRVHANLLVTDLQLIPSKNEKRTGRVMDLSEHGAFLESNPVKLFSEVRMNFVLPNRLDPINVKGRIVRTALTKPSYLRKSHMMGEESMGLGVQFTSVSREDRKALSGFLEATIPAPSCEHQIFDADPENKREHQSLFDYNEIDLALNQVFES